MNASFFSAESREAHLQNRWLVAAIFLGACAIYIAGELLSVYPYTDTRFVIGYAGTELVVIAYLVITTFLLFPAPALGLKKPAWHWPGLLPLVLVLIGVLATWFYVRSQIPAGVDAATGQSWLILRTTAMVGITEEWVFRGLLVAALCRWWGPRRGIFAALLLFSAFHLMNMLSGVSLAQSLAQFVVTFIVGAVFMLAAVRSNAIWLGAITHALYDFCVIDSGRMAQLGAPSEAVVMVVVTGLFAGVASLVMLWRHAGPLPYTP